MKATQTFRVYQIFIHSERQSLDSNLHRFNMTVFVIIVFLASLITISIASLVPAPSGMLNNAYLHSLAAPFSNIANHSQKLARSTLLLWRALKFPNLKRVSRAIRRLLSMWGWRSALATRRGWERGLVSGSEMRWWLGSEGARSIELIGDELRRMENSKACMVLLTASGIRCLVETPIGARWISVLRG